MAKRFKRFRPPLWLKRIREAFAQILVPLMCFQFIRTIFFPSTFDVFLLALLIGIYALLYWGII